MSGVAAVRVANVRGETSILELGDARASVEVAGNVQGLTPSSRMGPPLEAPLPALSPARTALADHLAHLVKLAAEVERASRPVDRLRDQLSAAMVELQNAELVL